MIYLLTLPLLIFGSSVSDENTFTVYLADGSAKVLLETRIAGHEAVREQFEIDTTSSRTEIADELMLGKRRVAFVESDRTLPSNYIKAHPRVGITSKLGLARNSPIHRDFANGFMIVPGRGSTLSMVLNPDNPSEGFCEDGSLFYVKASQTDYKFFIRTQLENSAGDELARPRIFHIDSTQEYDYLPSDIIGQLLDIIGPIDSSNIVSNCVLDQYPSIQFDIGAIRLAGERLDFVPSGRIVYSPEDYLEPIGNGRCILKIGEDNESPNFGLNFLSKVATHFNTNRLGFCDPLIH